MQLLYDRRSGATLLSFRGTSARIVAFILFGADAARADGATGAQPLSIANLPISAPDLFAGLLVIGFIVLAAALRSALYASKWTISDALSEEADVTLRDAQNNPVLDRDGKPMIGSELRASVSRLIAIFGLFAILLVYFGVGVVLVRRLAANEALPSKDDFASLQTFFFAGVTLFAPYIVNKFSSIFDWLKPPAKV